MSPKTPFMGAEHPLGRGRGRSRTDKLRYGVMRGEVSIPLFQQLIKVESTYPGFTRSWDANEVTWTGTVTPTPISETYTVKIEYSLEEAPRIWVIDPPLQNGPKGECPPHLYPEGCLCLYLPKAGEFDRSRQIAHTIIPWTALWLYYYEIWLATGEWRGGGKHPNGQSLRRNSV